MKRSLLTVTLVLLCTGSCQSGRERPLEVMADASSQPSPSDAGQSDASGSGAISSKPNPDASPSNLDASPSNLDASPSSQNDADTSDASSGPGDSGAPVTPSGPCGTGTVKNRYGAASTFPSAAVGSAISLDGKHLVVGTSSDHADSGSVSFGEKTRNGWKPRGTFKGTPNSFLGEVVAVSGSTAMASTQLEGAIQVFSKAASGDWKRSETITSSPPIFGTKLALDGDVLVVPASKGSTCAPPGMYDSTWGVVLVFERSDGKWRETQCLGPPNPEIAYEFGKAVAVSGNTLLIGTRITNADGFPGRVMVFRREPGGSWQHEQSIDPVNRSGGDGFGEILALDGDTAAISLHWNAATATSGAVDVLRRSSNGQWQREAYLEDPRLASEHGFGYSLALKNDCLIAGAPWATSSDADSGLPATGAAYAFARAGGDWAEAWRVQAEPPQPDALFGFAVGLTAKTVAISAPLEKRPPPDTVRGAVHLTQ